MQNQKKKPKRNCHGYTVYAVMHLVKLVNSHRYKCWNAKPAGQASDEEGKNNFRIMCPKFILSKMVFSIRSIFIYFSGMIVFHFVAYLKVYKGYIQRIHSQRIHSCLLFHEKRESREKLEILEDFSTHWKDTSLIKKMKHHPCVLVSSNI